MRSLGLGAVGVVALIGFAVAVSLLMIRATHAERIFPALSVADVPVGGMSFAAAAAALDERADAIEGSPITFRHGDKSIGLVLDQDSSNLPGVQQGMHSVAYPGLWLGSQELRIRHFHKVLDDYVYGPGGRPPDSI